MKIKDGFVLRKVADSYIVVKLGGEADFRKMITLNDTGAFIWGCVAEGLDENAIADKMADEYEAAPEQLKKDISGFISKMRQADVLE